MPPVPEAGRPVILFGAFDRHNFGDLLLPHIVARQLAHPLGHPLGHRLPGQRLCHAGLASRNLLPYGGHRVSALAQLAARPGLRAADIIHAGGEILCCEAWEAAVMLQPPDEAGAVIARLDGRPVERQAWTRSVLGVADLAPYVLPQGLFPHARRVIYNAVGGVGLDRRDPAMRAEVLGKLGAAAYVSVRDDMTRRILQANGVAARLAPDPAVMVAELFGARIRQRARRGEVARVIAAFPRGYLAVQFSADFGDDDTLDALAGQLGSAARATGHGVVLFRAGAAPWHDDLACYRRLAQRMGPPAPYLFRSLDIWDICALIAHSRGFAGSSLHGRIVAMAFALPRLSLMRPGQEPGTSKQAAFAGTWEPPGAPPAVAVRELADGIGAALAPARARMAQTARELVAAYRQSAVAD
ncbi:polysaccharide pyruvyl transferase family protein [Cupriavidus sp. 2TAF22]|uniref:polysaccharide pyruvyl transferase family protein n=1 Tax=unclassified Cupriavidus TaxID=2640874 RepID=UPI003F91BF07